MQVSCLLFPWSLIHQPVHQLTFQVKQLKEFGFRSCSRVFSISLCCCSFVTQNSWSYFVFVFQDGEHCWTSQSILLSVFCFALMKHFHTNILLPTSYSSVSRHFCFVAVVTVGCFLKWQEVVTEKCLFLCYLQFRWVRFSFLWGFFMGLQACVKSCANILCIYTLFKRLLSNW
jgi:hypothetical protein